MKLQRALFLSVLPLLVVAGVLLPSPASALYPSRKWTYRIKPDISRDHAVRLGNLMLLQGTDYSLHFVNLETGEMYWQFRFYAPVVIYKVDDSTLIALSDGIIHSLDVRNRKKVWSYRLKKPEFQKMMIAGEGNRIAVRYGERSNEVFNIRERVYPEGRTDLPEDFEEIHPAAPMVLDPEVVEPGSKLAVENRRVEYFPPGAEAPAWTFEADAILAPAAALSEGGTLYLIDAAGAVLAIDPATGAVKDRFSVTDFIKMRFWDEKPENIDNYSRAFLLAEKDFLYIIGPSSFSKVKFMKFPETVSLESRNGDSTFDWALEKAINAWDDKKYADAVRGMKEVVDIWPESSLAHLFMGMALSTIGNIDAAINELDEANRLEPGNPDIIANLAGNCILKIMQLNPETQADKIVELYRKVKNIQPVNRMAYVGLAELYLGKRDFDSAAGIIEESFDHGFFSPDLHLLLLSVYYMDNRKSETLKLADELIQLFPKFDAPYIIKGKSLCKQGRYSAAATVFEKAPKTPETRRELVSLFPLLLSSGDRFFYGNAAGLAGEYEKGMNILENFLAGLPSAEELSIIKSYYSLKQKNPNATATPEIASLKQRFEGKTPLELEAEMDFEVPSLLAIAHFQFILGMKEESLKTLSEAEKTGKDDPETLSYMGYLYSLNDKSLDKAQKYVLSALETDPEDSIFLRNYGVYLTTTGKFKESEEAFRKAVERNPNTELLFYEYGNLLAKLGRSREAVQMYRKELEMTPDLKLAAEAVRRLEK